MCPGAPLSLLDIDIDSSDEEIFTSLENILCGSPLPENVITDVDPFKYIPSQLPGEMWFLFNSDENKCTKFGFWKAKKIFSRVFPNSAIIGFKTTLVFYEGQTPHACKTDWIMNEYKVIKEGELKNRISMEEKTLCRIFLASELSPSPGKLQCRKADFPNGERPCGQDSKSFQEYKDIKVGSSAERECPNENQAEIDHLHWDDYIELHDLDTPLSPFESSGNSGCPILSTDEYFDPLALLSELEADISQDNLNMDGNCVSRNIVMALPSFDNFSVPPSLKWGSAALSKEVSESGNGNEIAEKKCCDNFKSHDS